MKSLKNHIQSHSYSLSHPHTLNKSLYKQNATVYVILMLNDESDKSAKIAAKKCTTSSSPCLDKNQLIQLTSSKPHSTQPRAIDRLSHISNTPANRYLSPQLDLTKQSPNNI